jgi:putative ABC transport system substrate-binding protein
MQVLRITMERQLPRLATAAGVLLCAVGLALSAEQAVVSALFSSAAAPYHEVVEGFRAQLQRAEIPLLVYERDLSAETPRTFEEHLSQKQPHVVLALGTRAALFCREHAGSVPVVFTMVLEPDSLVSAGQTGVSLNIPADTRLAMLRRILPSVKRIGVLHGRAGQAAADELSRAAGKQGVSVVSYRIAAQSELPATLSAMLAQTDCAMMVADPEVYLPKSVEHLLRSALEARVPVVGLSSMYTRAGALLSFDCVYRDIGMQAGTLAIGILDGERAGPVAPLAPSTLSYSLNVSVARQLGITLSREVLSGAGTLFGQ